MNARSVEKPSDITKLIDDGKVSVPERSPVNAQNVENLHTLSEFSKTWKKSQRSETRRVQAAVKHFAVFESMKEIALERNPINVENVARRWGIPVIFRSTEETPWRETSECTECGEAHRDPSSLHTRRGTIAGKPHACKERAELPVLLSVP